MLVEEGMYRGGFLGGLYHGKGTFTSINGGCFTGIWYKGLKHGKGRETNLNEQYEGRWRKGFKDGEGVLRKDGIVKRQGWSMGRLIFEEIEKQV